MKREAILIINTTHGQKDKTDVSFADAKRRINDYSTILRGLGEYSFEPHPLPDLDNLEAQNQISKLLDKYSRIQDDDENNCLIIYYHGHAVDRDDGLHFRFKDSDEDKLATFLSFKWIAEKTFDYGINKVIFILDCCYAGAGKRTIPNLTTDKKYFLMCSAIPTQKANIQPEKSPFGIFSLYLFDAFHDPEAANPETGNVTVKSFFEYAKRMLLNKDLLFGQPINTQQEPTFYDGALGEQILTKTKVLKNIDSRFNVSAPKKSYYSKYRWILDAVNSKQPISIDNLYKIVVKFKPDEFLTPIRRKRNTTYEPIKQSTFETYINGMQMLGILKENDILELTIYGRRMLSKSQSDYNNILLGLIEREFDENGLSLEGLEAVLRHRMATKKIPTASALYHEIRSRIKSPIGVSWFSILLDLLSYTGFIRLSTQKTYYPY